MYADRYGPRPINRGSLTLSVAIVGGLVAAAMLSNTVIRIAERDRDLPTYAVPPAPPPPPTDPQPRRQPKAPAEQRIDQAVPQVPTKPEQPFTPQPDPGPPFTGGDTDAGGGTGVAIDPPKPPPPVLRGADVDGRYARDFQPVYPGEERRAGHEGVVTLKVLVGIDGRVRQVERVTATSDAFWRVTETRALTKWRFRPATRDGVPYEAWKSMTVRFRLEEGE